MYFMYPIGCGSRGTSVRLAQGKLRQHRRDTSKSNLLFFRHFSILEEYSNFNLFKTCFLLCNKVMPHGVILCVDSGLDDAEAAQVTDVSDILSAKHAQNRHACS